jgi:hypothetical protein
MRRGARGRRGRTAWAARRDDRHRTLVGHPVEELLDYAERVGAELVAFGSHGGADGGAAVRRERGERAAAAHEHPAALLRRARVPEPENHEAGRIERQLRGSAETLDPAEWRLALDGFRAAQRGTAARSSRSTTRPGRAGGAQRLRLLGATFDQRDLHAELMLGDPHDRRRHLTRTIPRVGSVAVVTAPDGRDAALRIEHGKAQTLVSFPAE